MGEPLSLAERVARLLETAERICLAADGGRNAALTKAAYMLGGLPEALLPRSEAQRHLESWAEATGLADDEPRKTKGTIARGLAKGAANPGRGVPAEPLAPEPLAEGGARHNGRRRLGRRRAATPAPPPWETAWRTAGEPPLYALDPDARAERAAILGEALAVEALAAGRFTTEAEALAWGWVEADRALSRGGGGELAHLLRALTAATGAPEGWGAGTLAARAVDAHGRPVPAVGLRGVNVEECPGEAPRIAALPPWGVAPGLLADPHGLALLRGAPALALRGVLLAGDLAEWGRLAAQAAREGAPLAVLGVCPGDAPALAGAAARWPAHLELAALPACVRTVNTALAPLGRRAREVKP